MLNLDEEQGFEDKNDGRDSKRNEDLEVVRMGNFISTKGEKIN